jgi:hypothetical protein
MKLTFLAPSMLTQLGTVFVVFMLGAVVIGAFYRFILFPAVCFHFGETSRYDREARRRRRSFENRCAQALSWLYASTIAGTLCGVLSTAMPSIQVWALAAQIITFVVAGLFAWAAISRWREPYDD